MASLQQATFSRENLVQRCRAWEADGSKSWTGKVLRVSVGEGAKGAWVWIEAAGLEAFWPGRWGEVHSGEVLSVLSSFSCQSDLQNAIRYGLTDSAYRQPKLRVLKPQHWNSVASAPALVDKIRSRLTKVLADFPSLKALALATWFADTSYFLPAFIEWNYLAGLGHAIAVSGQHVLILSTIITVLFHSAIAALWSLGALSASGNSGVRCREIAPLLSALLLAWLCEAQGAVFRSLWVVLFYSVFRWVGWSTSRSSFFLSSLALSLLAFPVLGSDWGFLLSAAGTFLLWGAGCVGVRSYITVSLLLPIWVIPFQLHFFFRWDPWGLLHNLAFAWSWALLWIPLGFGVVVLGSLPGMRPLLKVLEALFQSFEQGVGSLATHSSAVLRLGFVEAVFWTLLSVGAGICVFKMRCVE